jgi:hypothetical protein
MLLLSKLYSITFQQEDVGGSVSDYALIGLSDVDQESVYVWVDGRIADYLNWAPSEPNNNGNEDGVGMCQHRHAYYGMWIDIPMQLSLNFVCERQLRQIEGNCDIIKILHVLCIARIRLFFWCFTATFVHMVG